MCESREATPDVTRHSEKSSITASCDFISVESSRNGSHASSPQRHLLSSAESTQRTRVVSPAVDTQGVVDKDVISVRGKTHESIDASLNEACRRKQHITDMLSAPVVADRVREVRERWQQQEAALRLEMERRLTTKHRRAALHV
eukprot:CAMPEP_0176411938 /NCGR_PEP_ID=MMETSP0127-20121128/3872_1 /TAXON_ID=938130 /ORGANISM="Platyophrya macrostoma, Strain WH" /LENGTH=143 /DNA_ID=CAMNT_0017791565 /DNA_START=75 /DNA_END=503 /DNA_ORIENTATION=+